MKFHKSCIIFMKFLMLKIIYVHTDHYENKYQTICTLYNVLYRLSRTQSFIYYITYINVLVFNN